MVYLGIITLNLSVDDNDDFVSKALEVFILRVLLRPNKSFSKLGRFRRFGQSFILRVETWKKANSTEITLELDLNLQ